MYHSLCNYDNKSYHFNAFQAHISNSDENFSIFKNKPFTSEPSLKSNFLFLSYSIYSKHSELPLQYS